MQVGDSSGGWNGRQSESPATHDSGVFRSIREWRPNHPATWVPPGAVKTWRGARPQSSRSLLASRRRRPRQPHTWAAQAGSEELDFMAWTNVHTLAAQAVGAGIAIGAVLGLIIGGIREVWLLWRAPC